MRTALDVKLAARSDRVKTMCREIAAIFRKARGIERCALAEAITKARVRYHRRYAGRLEGGR